MQGSLTILGCNSALPTSERFSTAQVLQMLGRTFLIDCAEGTQVQLRKYKLKFTAIDHILISHLHGDHYLGLFGLLSSFNLLGRRKALNIYGPPELAEIVSFNLKHLEANLQFNIIYHDTSPKQSTVIYEDKKITVSTIPLRHRIPTTGFLFKEKQGFLNIRKDVIDEYGISLKDIVKIKLGGDYTTQEGTVIPNELLTLQQKKHISFAFCSDTAYSEQIIPLVQDVDLLYHEATFPDELQERARETYHSTASQAATIARKANATLLAIGHYSARVSNIRILEHEAKRIFENTIAVCDGMVIPFG